MDEWERVSVACSFGTVEPGWRGLWRHFLSTVLCRELPTIFQTATLSVWMRSDSKLEFTGVQIEPLQ